MPRKKSQRFSAFVLTCDRLSTWPIASKTTITVIDLWTSMPTYLTLFIGRLLAIGNLEFCNLRLLLAGRPFILRGENWANRSRWSICVACATFLTTLESNPGDLCLQ